MAMFSDAKVGDRVWSVVDGWGQVTDTNVMESYPFRVLFDIGGSITYTLDGREKVNDLNPTLFWDKVTIVPPERPKEHEHNFDEPILNDKAENIGYECKCGTRLVPKETCEACFRIAEMTEGYKVYNNDILWLLSQHHTCEKEITNG